MHKLLDYIVQHDAVESLVEHCAWLAEDTRERSTCRWRSSQYGANDATAPHPRNAKDRLCTSGKSDDIFAGVKGGRGRLGWLYTLIAKFHYTDPTGPARTFFAAKLRWVRAGL